MEKAEIGKSGYQAAGYQNIRESGLKIDVFIRVNSWFCGLRYS